MEKEQQYLNFVFKNIESKLTELGVLIEKTAKQIEYLLGFISDTYTDMDDEEVVTTHDLLNQEDIALSQLQEERERLEFQKQKPYFARFDFKEDNAQETQKVYIGRGSIVKAGLPQPLVSDWRAPISSMFYDFELGKASYESLGGEISGELSLKRQYKLEGTKLEYFFDTSVMIYDEILQKELSQSSSSGFMKSIVATIQKEQNQIIRNESNQNLIVQGVAGSGKTAIALHRIAYLLYKHKNMMSSSEVMILSPNNLFSYYISNVLPELGEKNVLQTTFLLLAKEELGNEIAYEDRSRMLDRVLSTKQAKDLAEFKESFEYYEALKTFLEEYADNGFKPKQLRIGKQIIEADLIKKLYFETYAKKSPAIKIEWIADYILDEFDFKEQNKAQVLERIRFQLYKMFATTDILRIYREFLFALELPDLKEEKIYFEDLPSILFIKHFMFSVGRHSNIKHLVIDEMQDFSPTALKVLEIMFPCAKTLLGDINQAFFKTLNKEYLNKLTNFLENSKLIELEKSYRSTKQITNFSADLIGLKNISHINREGEAVKELFVKEEDIEPHIINFVTLENLKHRQVAILCESEQKAKELYVKLPNLENITLVEEGTEIFPDEHNCLIMSVAMSKGLEFDSVLAVSNKNMTKINQSLLYVMATRALHNLCVIYQEN